MDAAEALVSAVVAAVLVAGAGVALWYVVSAL
jgi:hypothetical protein